MDTEKHGFSPEPEVRRCTFRIFLKAAVIIKGAYELSRFQRKAKTKCPFGSTLLRGDAWKKTSV